MSTTVGAVHIAPLGGGGWSLGSLASSNVPALSLKTLQLM
jgi:hypothetical protein